MKQESKKKHKGKKHRNAGMPRAVAKKIGATGRSAYSTGARLAARRAAPPDWKMTLAAIAGGAGGAVLSGLAVNQNVVSAEGAALSMIGLGTATAYFADGHARVVGNSLASAGAGQYALAKLARRAAAKAPDSKPADSNAPAAPKPAELPAPGPATTPDADYRKDEFGAGYVTSIFRDAAHELDLIDDEDRRMGQRDAEGVDVYDLDDLVA